MKSFIHITTGIYLACLSAFSQSQDQNYIRTRTMTNETGTGYIETIQYFDGLGRPVETVQKGITPNKADLVSLREYDAFGRESNAWLPGVASGNNGAFIADPRDKIKASYANDANPYSRIDYEASPLNRPEKQFGPGQSWHANGKAVKTEYLSNTSSGDQSCAYYEVTSDGQLKKTGNYGVGQLYVIKTTDEDAHVSYEFKDKLGQVVLTRQMSGTNPHSTYYVYDDFGKKRFVLSPAASDALASDSPGWDLNNQTLKDYAYIYKYDNRLRCSEKKIPGADPIYYVYDKADRLILTQDGNQRVKSEWSFSKYDVFGRMILSGVLSDTRSLATLTAYYNNIAVIESPLAGGDYGYSKNCEPKITADKVLIVNYYDDYEHLLNQDSNFRNNLNYETKAGYGERYVNAQCPSCSAKGLLVGTRVKMLDGGKEIVTAMYYDDKGRMVQTKLIDHTGGVDREYVNYDFVGNPLKRQIVHGIRNITENYRYEYDHAGRPVRTFHKIDNQSETKLSELTYDDLGRISKKTLHTGMENIYYSYNVRNWLTSITSPRFQESLYYTATLSGGTACYNGNISAIKWKVDKESFYRAYRFNYDGLDRLTGSTYGEGASAPVFTTTFAEAQNYDKNGNITRINRYGTYDSPNRSGGGRALDVLTYTYSGNQIKKISDSGSTNMQQYGSQAFFDGANLDTEYMYDPNGNMTVDYNKGIAKINYNCLNLPEYLQFKQGHVIKYRYDAAGVKRKADITTAKDGVNVSMGNTLGLSSAQIAFFTADDYCGNVMYSEGGQAGTRVSTPEGYVSRKGTGSWEYTYQLKDHLGNVRYEISPTGSSSRYTHYYPFGMEFIDGDKSGLLTGRERYNGKELQTQFGLNIYDYIARGFDGAVGRFWQPDPLAERTPWMSPYAYALNNPIKYVDPDGRFAVPAAGIVFGIGVIVFTIHQTVRYFDQSLTVPVHSPKKEYYSPTNNSKPKPETKLKDSPPENKPKEESASEEKQYIFRK